SASVKKIASEAVKGVYQHTNSWMRGKASPRQLTARPARRAHGTFPPLRRRVRHGGVAVQFGLARRVARFCADRDRTGQLAGVADPWFFGFPVPWWMLFLG